MLAQLTTSTSFPKILKTSHLLVLLPRDKSIARDVPHRELLATVLKRRGSKLEDFASTPVAANASDGSLIAWAMLDFSKPNFAVQTQARKAVQLLLGEQPASIAIVVQGDDAQRRQAAEAADICCVGERRAIAAAQEKIRPAQAAAKDRAVRICRRKKFCLTQGAGRRQSAVPYVDRAAAERADTRPVPQAHQGT